MSTFRQAERASATFHKEFTFSKFDDASGFVYGFAIVSTEKGLPYWDLQGDHIPEDAMVKAAADFMYSPRVGKDQHAGDQVADVVFGSPMSKDDKVGFWIGYKPQDPVHYDMIKSGERTGFSIGGVLLDSQEAPIGKAVWSTAFVDGLPDSAFLYVKAGGKKDASGKTTPRSNRMFPVRGADGKADAAHVKNALSRVSGSNIPAAAKASVIAAAQKLLSTTKAEEVAKGYGGKGGERKGRVFRTFKIAEISLVDRPAQEGATVDLVKHVIAAVDISKSVVLTSEDAGHQHAVCLDDLDCDDWIAGTTYAFNEGADKNDGTDHAHKLVVEDGVVKLAANAGHTHTVTMPDGWTPKVPAPVDNPSTSEVEIIAASAPREGEGNLTLGKSGLSVEPTSKELKMTEAEIAALNTRVADAEKARDRAFKMAELTDTQKSYFGKLDQVGQSTFLAKSHGDRDAEVTGAVLHKTATGVIYFRGDDQRMVDLAKDNERLTKAASDADELRKSAEYAKQAATDLCYIKGEDATHAAIVRAIHEGIKDEAVRKAAFETIRAGNHAAMVLTQSTGHSTVSKEVDSAEGAFYKARDEWAAKEKVDMSTPAHRAQATQKFRYTPEGMTLQKALNDSMPQPRAGQA